MQQIQEVKEKTQIKERKQKNKKWDDFRERRSIAINAYIDKKKIQLAVYLILKQVKVQEIISKACKNF